MTKKYVLNWKTRLWFLKKDKQRSNIFAFDLFKAKVFSEQEKIAWEKQNSMTGYQFHQLPE